MEGIDREGAKYVSCMLHHSFEQHGGRLGAAAARAFLRLLELGLVTSLSSATYVVGKQSRISHLAIGCVQGGRRLPCLCLLSRELLGFPQV